MMMIEASSVPSSTISEESQLLVWKIHKWKRERESKKKLYSQNNDSEECIYMNNGLSAICSRTSFRVAKHSILILSQKHMVRHDVQRA